MEFFLNMIANLWDGGLLGINESSYSTEMIEDSVERACDFFHIEQPESIEPGYSTAVRLGDADTYQDDILFYNRAQLEGMGITGQDALDLVMTHEGTHRILQNMETGFDCYQEELCCDYMAGVRAGLNSMDVSQFENALANETQSFDHPAGNYRVEAIERGLAFANEYVSTHGIPPTFNECYEDFIGDDMRNMAQLAELKNNVFAEECTMEHYRRIMENEPDNEVARISFNESKERYENLQNEYSDRISFRGLHENVDSLYDPHINRSVNNLKNHLDDIKRGKIRLDEASNVLDKDQNDINFWQRAKFDAKIDAAKDEAFLDHINKLQEINDKYRIEKRY